MKDKETIEFRYYISSLSGDAWKIGRAIRSHWSVENKLHWQLDVSYGEDNSKVRKDNGPENFSVIRRATLNLLKADKKTKAGIKNKRSKAEPAGIKNICLVSCVWNVKRFLHAISLGTIAHYDSINNMSVITNIQKGNVITTSFGQIRQ